MYSALPRKPFPVESRYILAAVEFQWSELSVLGPVDVIFQQEPSSIARGYKIMKSIVIQVTSST
jgi:hypothetical protein